MALSRLALAWLAVTAWLLAWELLASRLGAARSNARLRRARIFLGEALLITLFGALWFGSLGTGAWCSVWSVRFVNARARAGDVPRRSPIPSVSGSLRFECSVP